MRSPFDPDSHACASVRTSAGAAMRVIDAIQELSPAVAAHGIAAAFLLLAERYEVEASELFQKTTNLMNYAEGRRPEFAAVAEYLAKEL